MLFCREFENVVNHAFLVLFFLGEKLDGANFYAFCNYVSTWGEANILITSHKTTCTQGVPHMPSFHLVHNRLNS